MKKEGAGKEKLKSIYGLSEKQFNYYASEAVNSAEHSGEFLLRKLETRLDNVVYRLGLAKSRKHARKLIAHGHIKVNEQRLDVLNYHVEQRDIISLDNEIFSNHHLQEILFRKTSILPPWLDREKNVGWVVHLPQANELRKDIDVDGVIKEWVKGKSVSLTSRSLISKL